MTRRMMKSLYYCCAIITTLLAVVDADDESSSSRIIGGTNAPPGRYPYMVNMADYDDHKCGGTLVAPDVVLTAAHCVGFFNEVQLGRYSLTQTTPYERWLVQEIVTHPRFYSNSPTENDPYDFCLVKFYGASSMPFVRLNRDPTLPAQTGDDLVITGWGTSDPITFFPPTTDSLQQATVQYISNDECIDLTPRATIDVTLCALGNGTDSCTGDSGGPILLLTTEEEDLQIGLTSSGASTGCADEILPGLYARTSEAMDWIDEEVCRMSSNPPKDFQCPNVPRGVVTSDNETTLIIIEIDLDAFPNQTGWILQSTNEYGVNVTYASQPFFTYSNSSSTTVVTEEVLLPDNQEYTLILLDLFGNGMCCKQGGLIIREDETNVIYVVATPTDLQSYSAVTFDFVVGVPPTDAPTTTPAPSATFFPSSSPTMTRPFLSLEIIFDSRSVETGWFLEAITQEEQEDVLLATSYPGAYVKYEENSSVIEQIFLLSPNEPTTTNYRFVMTDNEGNGICCGASGNGTARLYAGSIKTGTLLREFGDFLYEDEFLFSYDDVIVVAPTPATMPAITMAPATTMIPEETLAPVPVALTKPPTAPVESTKAPVTISAPPVTTAPATNAPTTNAPATNAPATTTVPTTTITPVAPVTVAPTPAPTASSSFARRAASSIFVLVVTSLVVL